MKAKNLLPLLAIALLALPMKCSCDVPHMDIGLYISAAPTTFSQAGDQIAVTFTLNNEGTFPFIVQIFETSFPTDCDFLINLSPFDGPVSCTQIYTVTNADVLAGKVTITAWTSAMFNLNVCGPQEEAEYRSIGEAAALIVYMQGFQGIQLTSIFNTTFFSQAGQEVTSEFTITNDRDEPLCGPVRVEDSLMEITCPEISELAPGESVTCRGVYVISPEDLQVGILHGSAVAWICDLQSQTMTYELSLEAQPALGLEVASHPNFYAFVGDGITFTYLLTNTGNVPLTGPFAIASPTLDTWGCPYTAVLAPGETLTCEGRYQITSTDLGYHLIHAATAIGMYNGQEVSSLLAELTVYFSPPEQSSEQPPAEPAVACGDFNFADCQAHSADCTWNTTARVCENK